MISENQHLTRQMDLIPLHVLDTPINIIGAGAIGSFTALALAKMGFNNITAIDFDHIDVENMNCQFFRFKDIGSAKVIALQSLIKDFTNLEINAVNDAWNGQIMDGITICAVDSMAVRKQVFDAYNRKAFKSIAVIDPRMGAETSALFQYNPLSPSELKEYSNTLYSDEDAVQERCTSKSTIYTTLGISSIVCTAVKELLVNKSRIKNVMYDMKTCDIITSFHKVG